MASSYTVSASIDVPRKGPIATYWRKYRFWLFVGIVATYILSQAGYELWFTGCIKFFLNIPADVVPLTYEQLGQKAFQNLIDHKAQIQLIGHVPRRFILISSDIIPADQIPGNEQESLHVFEFLPKFMNSSTNELTLASNSNTLGKKSQHYPVFSKALPEQMSHVNIGHYNLDATFAFNKRNEYVLFGSTQYPGPKVLSGLYNMSSTEIDFEKIKLTSYDSKHQRIWISPYPTKPNMLYAILRDDPKDNFVLGTYKFKPNYPETYLNYQSIRKSKNLVNYVNICQENDSSIYLTKSINCTQPVWLSSITKGFVGETNVYLFSNNFKVYYFDSKVFEVVGSKEKFEVKDFKEFFKMENID